MATSGDLPFPHSYRSLSIAHRYEVYSFTWIHLFHNISSDPDQAIIRGFHIMKGKVIETQLRITKT